MKLSIKNKIYLTFLVIVFMSVFILGAQSFVFIKSRNFSEKTLNFSIQLKEAEEKFDELDVIEKKFESFMTIGSEESRSSLLSGANKLLESEFGDPQGASVKSIIKKETEELNRYTKLVADLNLNSEAGKVNIYALEIYKLLENLRILYKNFQKKSSNSLYLAIDDQHKVLERLSAIILLTELMIIILGIGFSIFINRDFVKGFSQLKKYTENVAKGNLGAKTNIESEDEIGQLADAMHDMASKLAVTFMKLHQEKKRVKTQNAKMTAFLESVGEGLIAMDLKGRVMMMNKVAEAIFSNTIKNLLGKSFFELYTFENKGGNTVKLEKSISSRIINKKESFFVRLYLKQGGSLRKTPLAISVAPILLGDKILGIISTFRDISEEMAIDEAKDTFLSLASHQLRTPLTGIKWLVQTVAKKGGLNKLQSELLGDAISSNDRMIRLVDDLLNISRLEAGAISVTPEEVDLPNFLKKMISEVEAIAKEKKQKIIFKNPKEKIMVFMDIQLIRQVILNLLSNAIKYTKNEKNITVEVKKMQKKVVISVKDQGIGISKEDKKRLFTRFFRAADAVALDAKGSGLGLYIIKKVLDISKGSIKVQSIKGKGTSFVVTIPLKCPSKKEKSYFIPKEIS